MTTSERLVDEVVGLTRRLRMPYQRKAAPGTCSLRQSATVGPRGSTPGAPGGRSQGTRRCDHRRTAAARLVPDRQALRDLARELVVIPVATQRALRTLEWVRRAENLAVVGPSSTGKSPLLEALGNAAIDDGMTVAWFTVETLGQLVRRHRADDTVTKAVKRVLKADVIVVADFGLLPVPAEAAEALFRVIEAAYERRSIAISSNIHPGGFDELLPTTIASAGVDRFTQHAHVVVTEGDSYRFAEAATARGVTPLT